MTWQDGARPNLETFLWSISLSDLISFNLFAVFEMIKYGERIFPAEIISISK